MQMRRYDVENFMERRRLPLDIRKYKIYYLLSKVYLSKVPRWAFVFVTGLELRLRCIWLCRQVRLAERFKWVATHGVEDDEILDGFSEDLQIKIKCHVCGDLLKEV
jgi:hypothetical protein